MSYNKNDKLYEEYLVWLKQQYNITPEETYCNINCLEELKHMRDEYLGLFGETDLIKMLKEDGVYEERKKKHEKMIITFDEYKKHKNEL